jgi:hypothetical protein
MCVQEKPRIRTKRKVLEGVTVNGQQLTIVRGVCDTFRVCGAAKCSLCAFAKRCQSDDDKPFEPYISERIVREEVRVHA